MNIADFITELYRRHLARYPQHPQAVLSISELVTGGVLHAIKNVRQRPDTVGITQLDAFRSVIPAGERHPALDTGPESSARIR